MSRSTMTAGVSNSETSISSRKNDALRHDLKRRLLIRSLVRHHVLNFDRCLITTRRETCETYVFSEFKMRQRPVLNLRQHVIEWSRRRLTILHESHCDSHQRLPCLSVIRS